MNKFEQKIKILFEELPNVSEDFEVYLVSNIFSELSLYIVDGTPEIILKISEKFKQTVKDVETITTDDFIYDDLQDGKISIINNKRLFYVERHRDKSNWFTPSKHNNITTKIISFYSFKGGLGRTTALVLSAITLARKGKRIVMIDFDLEAPGLSSLFLNDNPSFSHVKGVTDFMLDLSTNTFDTKSIDLAEYYFSLNNQDLVGTNGGELIIFPATQTVINDNDLNYIDKLSKLDIQYNSSEPYAPDYLLEFIDKQLEPDMIMIDTRTGVNDIGGLVFNRYADASFIFSYGNIQNIFGLKTVLEKIKSKTSNIYLINSPVPREENAQKEEINYFIENSYEIFCSLFYEKNNIPDINDDTANHYPINIPYNDTASFLNSTKKLREILEEKGNENPYLRIGELILAELPQEAKVTSSDFDSAKLILAMSKIIDETAASENEFSSEQDLKINFYPRKDYRFIFDKSKFLVLGEKGSGKTALYAVLSHNSYAKELAKFCDTNNEESKNTTWLKGLDTTLEYPSQTNFSNLKDLTDSQLRNYWLILLIRSINKHITLDIDKKIINAKSSELKSLSKDSDLSEILEEAIESINTYLKENNSYITIIYDYLDRLLSEENQIRGRLVGALLSLWYEYHTRFSNVKSKIFLRKDIYDREITTGLTDKVKLDNFKQEIEWNQTQLLDMVWKRIIERDEQNTIPFIKQSVNLHNIKPNNTLGHVPTFNEEEHTLILENLFGKRMGSNNKAFPYNWIEQHIADTHRNIQPRSILNLFGLGAQRQLEDRTPISYIVRAYNFENVLAEVSKRRVRDLEEEYPTYKPIFDQMHQHLNKFPVTETQLTEAILTITKQHKKLKEYKPEEIIIKLMEMGVLYEYKYNSKKTGVRYHIPDLYLFGLGLSRLGPGAHKAMFDNRSMRPR